MRDPLTEYSQYKDDNFNAKYIEHENPDFQGNPNIAALPRELGLYEGEVTELLKDIPEYSDGQRLLHYRTRLQLLGRLLRFFIVLPEHLRLEEEFSFVLRQSYVGRNPMDPKHFAKISRAKEKFTKFILELLKNKIILQDDDKLAELKRSIYGEPEYSSQGFSFIAYSGSGKSTVIKRVISLYPPYIIHEKYRGKPLYYVQIPILKVECPHDASLKTLLMLILKKIDELVGETYSSQFDLDDVNTSILVNMVGYAVLVHHIGVLVIDEFQFLSIAKSGGEKLVLNFLTSLNNILGSALVIVGTYASLEILEKSFRFARRGMGTGFPVMDRMYMSKNPNEPGSWEIFLNNLWKFQYTNTISPLTPELSRKMYDLSQGIIYLTIAAYLIAQKRVIQKAPNKVDGAITVQTLEEVEDYHFTVIKPMLDILRRGEITLEEKKRIDDIFFDKKKYIEKQTGHDVPESSGMDQSHKNDLVKEVPDPNPDSQVSNDKNSNEKPPDNQEKHSPPADGLLGGEQTDGGKKKPVTIEVLTQKGFIKKSTDLT
jgi:hypothetical protein